MKRSLKLFAVGIVFSVVFCLSQCRKDNPKPDNPYGLPNATQWGAGIFACLINGQKYIAKRRPGYIDGTVIVGDTLYVSAYSTQKFQYTSILIYIKNFTHETKDYSIDSINIGVACYSDSTCLGFAGSTTSFSKTGNIVITKFDTTHRIVSGTFDGFTFPIPGCDTLYVTNGRFDYHYYYN